ncbi:MULTISPECIES: hypothetical protein [unclassified Nocardia]|uniref:hypothetical protein n=1 Tax=unclassified Nocardia TaxID=2637762 RepID=UPI0024A98AD2|nr:MULTISPECIES: hypothetical protein [unclassified Nocardia]
MVIDLFRQRPQLAVELLTLAGDQQLPRFDNARLESGDFPDICPTEYRADTVVVLTEDSTPVLAVVVEVQLRPDGDKTWSWPVYLTTLRARLRCATVLLVLCPDEHTAHRCRTPITVAPAFVLTPTVIGPANVPAVTDARSTVANPELAVLSAIAYRNRPERDAVLTALVEGALDVPHGKMYVDLVMAILPRTARSFLETLMTTGTYQYKSEFARRYFSEGEARGQAQGEARALLTVLHERGMVLPESAVTRIHECDDTELLNTWIARAVTAGSLDEVFDD